jgi:hypothetical protein
VLIISGGFQETLVIAVDHLTRWWRDHIAALRSIFLGYAQPKESLGATGGSAQRGPVTAVLLTHGLPYLLLFALLGRSVIAWRLPEGMLSAGVFLVYVAGGVAYGLGVGSLGGSAERVVGAICAGIAFGTASALPVVSAISISQVALAAAVSGLVYGAGIGTALRASLRTAALIGGVYGFCVACFLATPMGLTHMRLRPDSLLAVVFVALFVVADIVGIQRLYYKLFHVLFIWPKVRGNQYPYHPLAWDALCPTNLPALDRLLIAYADVDREACEREVARLASLSPRLGPCLRNVGSVLIARDSSKVSSLRDLAAVAQRLPDVEEYQPGLFQITDGLHRIARLRMEVDEIRNESKRAIALAGLIRHIEAFERSLVEGGMLAGEFRMAATAWRRAVTSEMEAVQHIDQSRTSAGSTTGEDNALPGSFRIFVSSTFADMGLERAALHKVVFPRLQGLCRRHDFEFEVVDLRLGVSEEAVQSHRSVLICLEELRRCQENSLRPYMLILLGERYGSRPLPPVVNGREFDELLSRVPTAKRDHLKYWYRRDLNAVPEVYVLRPRRGLWLNDVAWIAEQELILGFLAAAGTDLPLEARLKYGSSATEQEVVQGLLARTPPDASVFCFIRTIEGLPDDRSAGEFVDIDRYGKVDRAAREAIGRLRAQVRRTSHEAVTEYTTRWTGEKVSDDFIEGFSAEVLRVLEPVVVEELHRIENRDPIEAESNSHWAFATGRARSFKGREEELDRIQRYVSKSASHPLAIVGRAGVGKTALIAQAAQAARRDNPESHVVLRFVGATAASSDTTGLLHSLCREVSRIYGVDDELPLAYSTLASELADRIALATPTAPLIIFLDAIDQLCEREAIPDLVWLPWHLSSNVRMVVSIGMSDEDRAVTPRLPSTERIALDPMTESEGEALLKLWLRDAGRTLRPDQFRTVLGNFEQNGSPLYLRMAFAVARYWHSYDDSQSIGKDVGGIVKGMLDSLVVDRSHGSMLVTRSLTYLAVSRLGLTENELLGVLSDDPEVMEEFRRSSPHSPPVIRLPLVVWSRLFYDLHHLLSFSIDNGTATLRLYHRQLQEAVEDQYIDAATRIVLHRRLAAYFDRAQAEGKRTAPDSNRRLSELPYHQLYSQQWNELESTLCDLGFIAAECSAGATYALIEDFDRAERFAGKFGEASGIVWGDRWQAFSAFLRSEVECFVKFAQNTPQFVFQQAYNALDNAIVAEAAANMLNSVERPSAPWLRVHARELGPVRYPPPRRYPKPIVLERRDWYQDIMSLAVVNADRFVAGHLNGYVAVWRIASGVRAHYYQAHAWQVASVLTLDDRRFASGGEDGVIRIWDVETAEMLGELRGHGSKILCLIRWGDRFIISGSSDRTWGLWDFNKPSARARLYKGHSQAVSGLRLVTADILETSDGNKERLYWRLPKGTAVLRAKASAHGDRAFDDTALAMDEKRTLTVDYHGVHLQDWATIRGAPDRGRGIVRFDLHTAVSWHDYGEIVRWDLDTLDFCEVARIPFGRAGVVVPLDERQVVVATELGEDVYIIDLFPNREIPGYANWILKAPTEIDVQSYRDQYAWDEFRGKSVVSLTPEELGEYLREHGTQVRYEDIHSSWLFAEVPKTRHPYIDLRNHFLYLLGPDDRVLAVLPGSFSQCRVDSDTRIEATEFQGTRVWIEIMNQ